MEKLDAVGWITKGKKSFVQNELPESRAYFLSAIEMDPDNAEAYAFLAAVYGRLIEKGGFMDKLKYLPHLEKTISTALRLNPESTIARRVNAFKLLRTPKEFGGSPKRAIDEFLFCIGKGPEDHELYYGLGLAYTQVKDYPKAKQSLEKGIELKPEDALIIKELEFVNRRVGHGNH